MKSCGSFSPVAEGAEIQAERWSQMALRDFVMGWKWYDFLFFAAFLALLMWLLYGIDE